MRDRTDYRAGMVQGTVIWRPVLAAALLLAIVPPTDVTHGVLPPTTTAAAATTAPASRPPAADGPRPDLQIDSVLGRDADVLAVGGDGIYRAARADRAWRRMPAPVRSPWRCRFVSPPAGSGVRTIYVYTTRPENWRDDGDLVVGKWVRRPLEPDRGFYASDDDGRTWQRRAGGLDFASVLWHPDGSLFALAEPDDPAQWQRTVLRSTDGGIVWRNVTGNAGSLGVGRLNWLFLDPRPPHRPAVAASGARAYVVVPDDDSFIKWHAGMGDRDDRLPDDAEKFFRPYYGFAGIRSISDYYFGATFGNYFDHPFGSQLTIPPFDLRVDRDAYTFRAGDPKVVRATIRFRRTDHGAALFDLKHAPDFWGLRVIGPTGRRTIVPSLAAEAAHAAKNRETYEALARRYAEWEGTVRHELTTAAPYERALELDHFLYRFDQPGDYRVQLVYACPFWAGEGRSNWTGSFTGPVVTVTITPRGD